VPLSTKNYGFKVYFKGAGRAWPAPTSQSPQDDYDFQSGAGFGEDVLARPLFLTFQIKQI